MEYTFDYIIIKASKSPANLSINNIDYRYLKDTRPIKEYASEMPIRTDKKFQTLNSPNSNEFVNLQSKKIIKHHVELIFKENIDIQSLKECDSVVLVDNNGVEYDVLLESIEIEALETTTINKAKVVFIQILPDADSLSSFVETDYIKDRIDNGDFTNIIYLELKTNKDIDAYFNTVDNTIRFYTLFYPLFYTEQVGEDKIQEKTKTTNEFTISSSSCRGIKIKLFLSDANLAIFERYFKLCYWQISGVDYGTTIHYLGGDFVAAQTLNEADREINEDDTLVNLNEVNVTLKRDFLKTELFD